ncbi:hypothetical protein OBBRIDRAFT_543552 [Obba rivulosa]|uniref:Uncharacterized protein n=1 Tax=Obba rivulosa TaxID=1052685 RepID=A0A8E2AZZ8_9APHY|nr:hypothetical protein OBBRIDRAFT_543552 [Obba rivulosa]
MGYMIAPACSCGTSALPASRRPRLRPLDAARDRPPLSSPGNTVPCPAHSGSANPKLGDDGECMEPAVKGWSDPATEASFFFPGPLRLGNASRVHSLLFLEQLPQGVRGSHFSLRPDPGRNYRENATTRNSERSDSRRQKSQATSVFFGTLGGRSSSSSTFSTDAGSFPFFFAAFLFLFLGRNGSSPSSSERRRGGGAAGGAVSKPLSDVAENCGDAATESEGY